MQLSEHIKQPQKIKAKQSRNLRFGYLRDLSSFTLCFFRKVKTMYKKKKEVRGAKWHLYLLGDIRIQKGKRKKKEREMGVPGWSEDGW